MAYREIGTLGILEVLRRVHCGQRRRAAQRVAGRSRTTIRLSPAAAAEIGRAPAPVEAPTHTQAAAPNPLDPAVFSVSRASRMLPGGRRHPSSLPRSGSRGSEVWLVLPPHRAQGLRPDIQPLPLADMRFLEPENLARE